MRAALVTAFPRDPRSPKGGVEAVSVNLARGLAAMNDLEVHVVTADPAVADAEDLEWERARVHRVPRRAGRTLLHALGDGRRAIQQALARIKPDVVHAHDTYGLMVGDWPGPRVFTVHGIVHADTRLSGERFARLRALVWKWVETRLWAEQSHIIAISPYVRGWVSGVCRGAIHDVENPISPEFFAVPRAEVQGRILCAGAICRRKNAIALVEAVSRLAREGVACELRLAGPIFEPEYARRVEQSAIELKVFDRVRQLGNLTTDQLRTEISTASVFALLSLEESAPMGIAEAMAAGLPIVASNRCGMPFMVQEGVSGFLVDPNHPSEPAERLGRLLTDGELRARMSEAGRLAARERFHPDIVARRTREVYLETMKNGHPG